MTRHAWRYAIWRHPGNAGGSMASAPAIDRSFINEVPDNAQATTLLATIIDVAHALGKQVVAEGVETLPQLDYLRQRGCDLAQGYVLARPLNVADISALLAQQRGATVLLRRAAG